MSTRDFGRLGEKSACEYLKTKGFEILGTNVQMGHLEIDIIARNETYFVFAEVKTRKQKPDIQSPYGRPATAANFTKRKNMLSAAKQYLYENRAKARNRIPRIDLIEVYADPETDGYRVLDIRHFENFVNNSRT